MHNTHNTKVNRIQIGSDRIGSDCACETYLAVRTRRPIRGCLQPLFNAPKAEILFVGLFDSVFRIPIPISIPILIRRRLSATRRDASSSERPRPALALRARGLAELAEVIRIPAMVSSSHYHSGTKLSSYVFVGTIYASDQSHVCLLFGQWRPV